MTMERRLTFDEVVAAWTAETDRRLEEDEVGVMRSMAFTDSALKLLAQGQPVTPQALAASANLPLTEVDEIFRAVGTQGGELDDEGNLVGLALTLNPTTHQFVINGRNLFAWCSLDTIILPGLLGKTAAVESRCPVTGKLVRLTVTPDGVAEHSPASTVLSITVPGVSCRRADDSADKPQTGPGSDSCGQMYFFASREAGEKWLAGHPGVVLFTPDEAYRLAAANWLRRRGAPIIEPLRRQKTKALDCCC